MLDTFLSFIQEHSELLLALWGALFTIAYVVVKLTPTKRDDRVFETIFGILKALKLDPEIPQSVKDELEQVEAELEEEIREMDSDRTRDSLISLLD